MEEWERWEYEADLAREAAGRPPLGVRFLVWIFWSLAVTGFVVAISIWIWGVVAAFLKG